MKLKNNIATFIAVFFSCSKIIDFSMESILQKSKCLIK